MSVPTVVLEVNSASGQKGPKELRHYVKRQVSPRVSAQQAQTERHCWIKVGA